MTGRVTSLNDLCAASTKRLNEEMLVNKMLIDKSQFNVKKFFSEYVYKPLRLLCDFLSWQ